MQTVKLIYNSDIISYNEVISATSQHIKNSTLVFDCNDMYNHDIQYQHVIGYVKYIDLEDVCIHYIKDIYFDIFKSKDMCLYLIFDNNKKYLKSTLSETLAFKYTKGYEYLIRSCKLDIMNSLNII